jgi:phosphoribosylformimino-5-aminoimidazole carboxamide ribotide isomerase
MPNFKNFGTLEMRVSGCHGSKPRLLSHLGSNEVLGVILFPAIDLKNGEAVRLQQGDMTRATVFNSDPAGQARAFEQQGFEYLHLVDLDGAFAGRPINAAAVERILAAVKIPVQLGGGIRDRATIENWLGKGVARVIIGTAAVRNPPLVKEAARAYPDRVAVGLDARDGKVAVEGWAETSELAALDIAKRFEDAGVAAIIYTDVARDGMLKGLNLDTTIELADGASIPVIASGGLASIEDVRALLKPRARKLAGAIAGRALYDGRLDAAAALQLIAQARAA